LDALRRARAELPVTSVEVDGTAMADVAGAIERGQCLLFLGAGVHSPPPEDSAYTYLEEERPPLGSALSERLAEKCNLAQLYPKENPKNLQRTSLFFETIKGRKQLVDELKAAVQTGRKPSPILHALAELGFPLVATTNYDQLLQRALVEARKEPRVTVYSPDPTERTVDYLDTPMPEKPWVFKLHGDVDQPESIVITDEDYIQFVLRMTAQEAYFPVPMTFMYHLQRWTTLFVGYSLVDYNLRLLFKTLRWRTDKAHLPDTFSVDHYPDPLIFDVWHNQRRYLKFIIQDVWTFVPALYEMVLGKEMPDYRG
jgi:SIR2-like domain